MPQSLLGLKQIKSGEIGNYITGALGVSSSGSTVYTSKPYIFSDTLAVSGDVEFKNDFVTQENAKVKSGLLVSGDITGAGGLVVSGVARFENTVSFDDPVIFETGVTVSGAFATHGANTFNNTVTFGNTVTFNNAVSLNTVTVNGAATFNANTNLTGPINNIGAGGGSPSTSYYLGNHRFSGDSFFTGNATFRGANTFSGATAFDSGVTFNNGAVIFSGTGQGFATETRFSGDVVLLANVTGANLNITSSLGVGTTAIFSNYSPSYFFDDIYVSGAGASLTLRGNSPFNLLDSDVVHLSGIYDFSESTFNLNSGSIFEFKANSTSNLNTNATFSIKSGSKTNIQSGFATQNFGSVPATGTVPGGQLYLQKIEISGVTYYVLAMRQWA